MIRSIQLFTLACLMVMFAAFTSKGENESILGKWKTIDDETGKAKSIVELYEKNGKVYGKIIELLTEKDQNKLCTECKGNKKNQKIVGMEFVTAMKKDGKFWKDGEIMDPASGKTYDCEMSLEGQDKLKVRGFIGFSLLGRTQYWYRVK